MKYKVIIEKPAEQDIDEAFLWQCGLLPLARAEKWFAGLLKAIRSLSRFPRRHALAPENEAFDEEIRQLLYGRGHSQYRILFTIRAGEVHILHIRHTARRPLER
jgi:plasmid stabilization system protein ParE